MLLAARCTGCGKELAVPDNVVGSRIRCPECRTIFVVPVCDSASTAVTASQPAAGSLGDDVVMDLEIEEPKRRKKKQGRRPHYEERLSYTYTPHRGVLILIIGALSILLSCCPIIGATIGGIAIKLANDDLHDIYRGTRDPAGESMTSIGRILGVVGIGFAVFFAVLGFILKVTGW